MECSRYDVITVSLDLYAFVSALPIRATWQSAIDELNIGLTLDPGLDLAKDSGFSPCEINGKASGFEIYVETSSQLLPNHPSLAAVVGPRPHVICFRWGGDFAEAACVMGASLALVRTLDAIVYDPADDVTCDETTLAQDFRQCLAEVEYGRPREG